MKIAERFVAVRHGDVFVKIWEPAPHLTSTPLILIHDSLGSVNQWRSFPEQLAFRLQRAVVAYDRLGFGQSNARDELLPSNFIEEEAEIYFPALVGGLGFDRYALFGHSVGGAIALTIAATHPVQCVAVISESAQAYVEAQTLHEIESTKASFKDPVQLEKLRKWHGPKTEWVLDSWSQAWLGAAFKNWSLQPLLPQVKCPTLVIHGERDEFGSVAFPEMIGRHVSGPVEVKLLAGMRHIPHRESAELVLGLAAEFLRNRSID